jgi:hypothetical protein
LKLATLREFLDMARWHNSAAPPLRLTVARALHQMGHTELAGKVAKEKAGLIQSLEAARESGKTPVEHQQLLHNLIHNVRQQVKTDQQNFESTVGQLLRAAGYPRVAEEVEDRIRHPLAAIKWACESKLTPAASKSLLEQAEQAVRAHLTLHNLAMENDSNFPKTNCFYVLAKVTESLRGLTEMAPDNVPYKGWDYNKSQGQLWHRARHRTYAITRHYGPDGKYQGLGLHSMHNKTANRKDWVSRSAHHGVFPDVAQAVEFAQKHYASLRRRIKEAEEYPPEPEYAITDYPSTALLNAAGLDSYMNDPVSDDGQWFNTGPNLTREIVAMKKRATCPCGMILPNNPGAYPKVCPQCSTPIQIALSAALAVAGVQDPPDGSCTFDDSHNWRGDGMDNFVAGDSVTASELSIDRLRGRNLGTAESIEEADTVSVPERHKTAVWKVTQDLKGLHDERKTQHTGRTRVWGHSTLWGNPDVDHSVITAALVNGGWKHKRTLRPINPQVYGGDVYAHPSHPRTELQHAYGKNKNLRSTVRVLTHIDNSNVESQEEGRVPRLTFR